MPVNKHVKGNIFMEEVLEHETVPAGYEDIELYDDYGRRVTNLLTLQAIRESDEIVAEWLSRRK